MYLCYDVLIGKHFAYIPFPFIFLFGLRERRGNCYICFLFTEILCLQVVSAKVIRNKQTAQSEGYGFIEFVNRAAAEKNLQTFNGTLMPNAEQNFRLNWASFGVGEKRPDNIADFTIFVGDLAPDVTDYMLQETFRAHYSSVRSAKVVTDRVTGRAKGYGFVKFGDESEQLRAMTEMNGKFCSTRPMRIGPAANKKNEGSQQYPKGILLDCLFVYNLFAYGNLLIDYIITCYAYLEFWCLSIILCFELKFGVC